MRYLLPQEVFERLRSMDPSQRKRVPKWITPKHEVIEQRCKNGFDCFVRHGVVRKIVVSDKNLYCSDECLIAHLGTDGLTRMANAEFTAIGKETSV